MATSINEVFVIVQPGVRNVAVDFTTTRALRVYDAAAQITASVATNPATWAVSNTAAAIITCQTPGAAGVADVARPIAGTNAYTAANQTVAAGGIVRCISNNAGETATVSIFCVPG